MQNHYTYIILFTFIFFPLHGSWILERLEGLIATSPTHPPLFKTRAEIERDVRQCRQKNIPVRKWLHDQYADRSEKTLSNLLESLNPPIKINDFRQHIDETRKNLLPEEPPTKIEHSYFPPEPSPETEEIVKNFLITSPNKHIVQVITNAPIVSEVQYDNEQKGFILFLTNQDMKKHADYVLQHEYMHVANDDIIIGKTLESLDRNFPTIPHLNYLKNREYFADVGYALHVKPEQNMPKMNPSFWMQETLKDNYKEGYKRIGFAFATGYSLALLLSIFLNNTGDIQKTEIIPFSIISFVPSIILLALLPCWDAFFYGGPNHPSIIERWFAMNTVRKYLRVDQEVENN